MSRFSLAVVLGLAACSPAPVANLPEDRIPRPAVRAFIEYASVLGGGQLRCSAMAVAQAPRAEIDINDDGRMDYAIDTRQLSCIAQSGSATSYFCGYTDCAFPVIVSTGDGWSVIPMMSGNSIEAVSHYRDARFRVRSLDRGNPQSPGVLVRDYAWREGHLVRVHQTTEQPEQLARRQPS